MRPVIVGLRNPYRDVDALSPIKGAGKSLWKMSGMGRDDYVAAFERVNVEGLSAFDLRRRLAGRRVIVLGREAWLILVLPCDTQWFSTFTSSITDKKTTFTLLPHPSGRCRLYNDPANKERARRCLRGAVGSAFEMRRKRQNEH